MILLIGRSLAEENLVSRSTAYSTDFESIFVRSRQTHLLNVQCECGNVFLKRLGVAASL